MRNWTPEARAKQAEKIRQWQPWKTAGVKEGRVRSCRNALKHGCHTQQMRDIHAYLRDARHLLQALGQLRGGQNPAAHTVDYLQAKHQEGVMAKKTNSQNELL